MFGVHYGQTFRGEIGGGVHYVWGALRANSRRGDKRRCTVWKELTRKTPNRDSWQPRCICLNPLTTFQNSPEPSRTPSMHLIGLYTLHMTREWDHISVSLFLLFWKNRGSTLILLFSDCFVGESVSENNENSELPESSSKTVKRAKQCQLCGPNHFVPNIYGACDRKQTSHV